MALVYPFRALRPDPSLASRVASVPYDVVDRNEARALARDNPHSFLHVTKPDIDLPDDANPYGDAVYEQGTKALQRAIAQKTFVRDETPSFYVYELTMGKHTQTGIVFCASVADYDRNIVRKHEYTRPDKENDRVRHMEALQAQTGKVFLVHKDSRALDAAVKQATESSPLVDFTAVDGVKHRIWKLGTDIAPAFADLGPIYIADGHHRSAAASRVAEQARKNGNPKPESQQFLAVSFPASQVQILPYNRVVKDLNGLTQTQFMDAVKQQFVVTEGKQAPSKYHYSMYLANQWYTLAVKPGSFDKTHPVDSLDVSLLQDRLLSPILGISDPRRDTRIDFIGGIRGEAELERRVKDGWAVAFSLHACSIEELFAIADANMVMPPKSTWFEPKLRDGLFVHMLTD